MKSLLVKLLKRPTLHQLAVMVGGTAFAQLITVLVSPIITRIYSPADFGTLNTYLAIFLLLSPLAGFTYYTAIVLPDRDGEAFKLAKLSLALGTVIAILVFLALLLAGEPGLASLELAGVPYITVLLPVTLASAGMLETTRFWLVRHRQFNTIARIAVISSLVTNGAKVIGGVIHSSAMMLIAVHLGGLILSVYLLMKGALQRAPAPATTGVGEEKPASYAELAKEYRDFPLYRTPQAIIAGLSMSFPVMMLTVFFGPSVTGLYALAYSVLSMPVKFVGSSVSQVLYPKFNEVSLNPANLQKMILKSTAVAVLLGLIPAILVMAYGPPIFAFIFGQEWESAGTFAQCLAAWLLLWLVSTPVTTVIPVLRLQRQQLLHVIASTLLQTLAFYLGYKLFHDEVVAVAMFSSVGALSYLLLIVWVIARAGRPAQGPPGCPE